MDFDIRYYFKPEYPVFYDSIKVEVSGNDLSTIFSDLDKKIMEKLWTELKSKKGEVIFSTPGSLGSLHDTQNNIFTYRPSEFKVNTIAAHTFDKKILSEKFYNNVRISVVACALILSDGNVIIQKRGEDVGNFANTLDSSSAGYAPINKEYNTIDFKKSVKEKLTFELGIKESDIYNIKLIGVHTSRYDFTGTFDFLAFSELKKEDIENSYNKVLVSELLFIPKADLSDFIIEHYCEKRDLISEGCACLLASLPHVDFLKTIEKINNSGRKIEFGQLKNNVFTQTL